MHFQGNISLGKYWLGICPMGNSPLGKSPWGSVHCANICWLTVGVPFDR